MMVVLRSISIPSGNVELQLEKTKSFIHSGCLGEGTLYIAHSNLLWLNSAGEGFTLEYPAISLHAISRDTTSFPHQCLYVMLDSSLANEFEEEKENDSDDDEDANDESATVREVRFVPEDIAQLERMYAAMSHCQMLHPDPEDSYSEGEDEYEQDDYYEQVEDGNLENAGFFSDPSGVEHLTAAGRATLDHLLTVMDIGDSGPDDEPVPGGGAVNGAGDGPREPDQFEDADMD